MDDPVLRQRLLQRRGGPTGPFSVFGPVVKVDRAVREDEHSRVHDFALHGIRERFVKRSLSVLGKVFPIGLKRKLCHGELDRTGVRSHHCLVETV